MSSLSVWWVLAHQKIENKVHKSLNDWLKIPASLGSYYFSWLVLDCPLSFFSFLFPPSFFLISSLLFALARLPFDLAFSSGTTTDLPLFFSFKDEVGVLCCYYVGGSVTCYVTSDGFLLILLMLSYITLVWIPLVQHILEWRHLLENQ